MKKEFPAPQTVQALFDIVAERYHALHALLKQHSRPVEGEPDEEEIDIPLFRLDIAIGDLKTATDVMLSAARGQ